jgi:flavin reductase (DIM6/NTAB) family NADH-FMN oxidoreductase RutF
MEPRVSMKWKSNWWPAPVTLITVGADKPGFRKPNIWAVGVLGGPADDPPILTISPRKIMYSYRLMQEVPQFVVNFPTPEMLRQMEFVGTHSGIEADKWKNCGFTPIPGKVVDVPLIAECPVNIECVIDREIELTKEDGTESDFVLVVGRIVQVHAHERCVVNGTIQWDLVDTIIRSRPMTWRTVGPVIGYDARKDPLPKPEEASEIVNQRVQGYERLADIIRATPTQTQVRTGWD